MAPVLYLSPPTTGIRSPLEEQGTGAHETGNVKFHIELCICMYLCMHLFMKVYLNIYMYLFIYLRTGRMSRAAEQQRRQCEEEEEQEYGQGKSTRSGRRRREKPPSHQPKQTPQSSTPTVRHRAPAARTVPPRSASSGFTRRAKSSGTAVKFIYSVGCCSPVSSPLRPLSRGPIPSPVPWAS